MIAQDDVKNEKLQYMDLAENIVRPICVEEMDNQTHHVESSLIRGEEMCNNACRFCQETIDESHMYYLSLSDELKVHYLQS